MSGDPAKKRARRRRRLVGRTVLALLALSVAAPYALHRPPAAPAGTRLSLGPFPVADDPVRLLIDDTAFDPAAGTRAIRQEIMDETLRLVREAESVLVLDFFLWNGWRGSARDAHRGLARELADAVIARKRERPGLAAIVLTDPINRVYAADEESHFRDLAAAGVPVVFTDLDRLADSNVLYAAPAKLYGPMLARLPGVHSVLWRRRWAHPFDAAGGSTAAAQFLRLGYFKANHRKVAVADGPGGAWRMVASSMNPADGSSAHANMGLALEGAIAARVAREELKVVEWSAARAANVLERQPGAWRLAVAGVRARLPAPAAAGSPAQGAPAAEWLTEGAIRERILQMLNSSGRGDQVRIAMFYLSDRGVIQAIKDAAYGGARVRVVLDYNKDAFGRVKNGIPNRPVAAELARFAADERVDLAVRWAATHGEQFHTKALSVVNAASAKCEFLCGSANWTRRNLGNLNLEADAFVRDAPRIVARYNAHFDMLWSNGDGLLRTHAGDKQLDSPGSLRRKSWVGRIQEATGLSTF